MTMSGDADVELCVARRRGGIGVEEVVQQKKKENLIKGVFC